MKKAKRKRRFDRTFRRDLIGMLAGAVVICALLVGAMQLLGGTEGSAEGQDIRILRVMTSNTNTCLPVGGEYRDWLELVNAGETSVSLKGWRLSNGLNLREGFVFPDITLEPGESLVLYGGDAIASASDDALFLGFNLSADGCTLILMDAGGSALQSLEVPALSAGMVYALESLSGDSYVECSPFDDLEAGLTLSEELVPVSDSGLVINEVMALNASALQDCDGVYSDWIELYNGSDEAIDLEGYSLTDTLTNRLTFVFSETVLEPGEYLIVFADGTDSTVDELHAAFKLSSKGETVYLFDASGQLISTMTYDSMDTDESAALQDDGTVEITDMPSPGQPNTRQGWLDSLDDDYTEPTENALGLYINEVLTASSDTDDWVELINLSDSTIDLSGFGLSDTPSRPRKWTFPDGATIAPGETLLLHLTGSDGDSGLVDGYYCVDFALDVDSDEMLVLADADGNFVDRILLVSQRRDYSYGRSSDGTKYVYFASSTPGAANSGTEYLYCAQEVEFSQLGGVQDGPVTLTLSAEDGMTIYYTLDGTEPTVNSSIYSSPLTISTNTVVKAIAWCEDAIPSYSSANTYIFGVSHTVGIVAVSGDPDELTGTNGTLITGVIGSGYDVYAEIYDADGNQLISQGCMLKLNGKSSRVNYDQKAFRLVAKGEYGETTFAAALFSNRDYTEYNAIVLRASGQDNLMAYMRDVIFTSLAANTSVMYQESEVVVVYVNGEYWGVYHLRERVDAESICQFEGWDNPEDLDIIEGKNATVVQGSNSTYKEMMSAVRTYGVATDEYLELLRQYVDVENYLEYVMLQMYNNNQDLNNVRMYRNSEEDGLWHWVLYDTDLGFRSTRDSVEEWLDTSGSVGSITSQSNELFLALMENETMRDWFLTRFGELLATDLSSASVLARIEEEYETLLPEMEMECARWDWTVSKWQKYGAALVEIAETQTAELIESLIEHFDLTDEQAMTYFGTAMEQEGMLD